MSGTNIGAVYLDLRLDIKELQQGFDDVNRRIGLLGNAFGGLTDRLGLVKGGLGRLGGEFDGLIGQLPVLTRGFMENIDIQGRTEAAFGRLTNRTNGLQTNISGLIGRLQQVPFSALEKSAYGFGSVVDGLGDIGQTFGQRWHDVMLSARDDADDMGRSFGDIFGVNIPSVWQNMLGGMGEGWGNMWSGMKQGFHGIINRIIGGMNSMIGGLNRFQVNLPSWAGGGSFGFSIPQIPTIPALARGGIVDAPTLALVGERGREAVLPLENNTGWMADLANTLVQAMAANQGFASGASGGDGQRSVNLYMDSRKVAEGLIDDLCQVAERRDMAVFWA